MPTRAFFQGLSIAIRACSASLWRWFLSTRTEGPTNLGRCTYVSISDLTCGSGLELVATWNVTSERYLQGRKLERDVSLDTLEEPPTWTSSEWNYLEERNFSRFPSLNRQQWKIGIASGVAWGYNKIPGGFLPYRTAVDTKRTTVGDRRVLNSKCPKRVGSFGSSTRFLMRNE